ncbi:MAG: hypothetical protein J6B72_01480 [Clostridia bacterium]|nr:hypothetical protein [Clostridia bacterium]MBP3369305.1 hypothetical protein [Clostridia bacterium]
MKTKGNPRKLLWRGALAMILVLSMLVSASVMCFAQTTASDEANENETVEITGVNISLSDSIVVKFHTTAITDDGSMLKVIFKGDTYEISENEDGVFSFAYVTPQYMGEELAVTLCDANGNEIGEEKKVSVKSYLMDMLAYERTDGTCVCACESDLQHAAVQELCVNMLNYGAAAQTYVDHDTENLANAELTDEQKILATKKITVTETDKAVNGAAWVGAGVRFDYKLGLYFVFEAASADEYTATINGTEVTPEDYTALGEGYYVIRYNSFNATNMNDVVTAKLTKDGAEQTFSYSIKSYVAAKGGNDSAIANLVNATYVYGFAAVAYLQEYVEVTPTVDSVGSISIDGKGYDFSGSIYGMTAELPKLDLESYTVVSENTETNVANEPKIVTRFTLKSEDVDYSTEITPENAILIGEQWYSEYDLANYSADGVTVEYDKSEKSYTLTAPADAALSLTNLTSVNAPLTVTGKLEITTTATWHIWGPMNVGTETVAAEIARAGTSSVYFYNKTLVNKNSAMNLGSSFITGLNNCELIIDGTMATTNNMSINCVLTSVTENYSPLVYVRSGTLTAGVIWTNSIQVGDENNAGTLNVKNYNNKKRGAVEIQTAYSSPARFDFVNGTVVANGTSNSNGTDTAILRTDSSKEVRLYIGENIKFVTETPTFYDCLIGSWGGSNKYYYIDADAQLFVDADGNALTSSSGNFIRAYGSKANFRITRTVTVVIDETEKEVKLLHNIGQLNSDFNQTTFNNYFTTIKGIAEGTEMSTSDGSLTDAVLGEFKMATYGDGSKIYYQEITQEVA